MFRSSALPVPSRPAVSHAFTLVELMVSIGVVSILLAATITILSSTTSLTNLSRQQLDADSEARMIFDRMATDFSGMVHRSDVDYIFSKPAGNDALYFYSESPALADSASTYANTWALVGYRVNSSFQLERLGKGLTWGMAPPDGPALLTYSSSIPPLSPDASGNPSPALVPDANSVFAAPGWSSLLGTSGSSYENGSSSTYYHALANGVCRLEICFLAKPYTQPDASVLPAVYSNVGYNTQAEVGVNPARYLSSKYSGGTGTYTADATPTVLYGLGIADIQAIVVAVTILDDQGLKLAASTDIQTLAAALPDPKDTDLTASPPTLMAQNWNNVLASGTFTGGARIAAAHARVYQRTFPIGNYQRSP